MSQNSCKTGQKARCSVYCGRLEVTAVGVVLTVVGFAGGGGASATSTAFLVMQIVGPVCLATTCVMCADRTSRCVLLVFSILPRMLLHSVCYIYLLCAASNCINERQQTFSRNGSYLQPASCGPSVQRSLDSGAPSGTDKDNCSDHHHHYHYRHKWVQRGLNNKRHFLLHSMHSALLQRS